MQYDRFRCPLQQAYDIIQAISVLFSGATPFRHLTSQYLLCEDIEVEGDLYVHVPDLKCRHVRHNHLSWTVNRLPCRVYQIGIPVSDLARLTAYLMPGLGLDAEESEAFVGIALAYVNMLVDSDICSRPRVAMGAVLFVDCPYKLYLYNFQFLSVSTDHNIYNPLDHKLFAHDELNLSTVVIQVYLT